MSFVAEAYLSILDQVSSSAAGIPIIRRERAVMVMVSERASECYSRQEDDDAGMA